MRSKLFNEKPEATKKMAERWVRIFPDIGEGCRLYDPLAESALGRILFDAADNWIYDGEALSIDEQEDIAGFITGNQQETEQLIKSI